MGVVWDITALCLLHSDGQSYVQSRHHAQHLGYGTCRMTDCGLPDALSTIVLAENLPEQKHVVLIELLDLMCGSEGAEERA